jgi:hypothetical protein
MLKYLLMEYANSETDAFFNSLRCREFSRLDRHGHVYLDYTGGNLYPQSLVDKHLTYLKNEVYGHGRIGRKNG